LSATKKKQKRTATILVTFLFNQTHNNAIKNTPTVEPVALFMPASTGVGFVIVFSTGVITATGEVIF